MLILLFSHLLVDLYRFIAKNHYRVILSWWMLLRQVLGICSIFAKNMGNPYYESTIVVHNM